MFQKGTSGNPGGRKKGLTQTVRAKVGQDGKKLIDGWYAIAFGTPAQRLKVFGEAVTVSAKDRNAAMSELADRGFGKAPQTVDLGGQGGGTVEIIYRLRGAE